jgi:hemophore-related protein
MNTTSARWLRGIAVASGLMTAVVLSPAAGPASADPITSAFATTPCSYSQITSALNAQAPDLATRFSNSPQMQNRLQQLLALPIDQRQQRIAEHQAANPQMAQFIAAQIGPQGLQAITQVVNTCQNY